jgi:hypothetical protein
MKNLTRYEHKSDPLMPFDLFLRRLLRHGLAALLLLAVSLGLGIMGYHFTENLSWIDSLLNASMILGGMGPVTGLQTDGGKVFASFYALYSGIAFLVVAGVIIAPIAHRLMHRMHLEEKEI